MHQYPNSSQSTSQNPPWHYQSRHKNSTVPSTIVSKAEYSSPNRHQNMNDDSNSSKSSKTISNSKLVRLLNKHSHKGKFLYNKDEQVQLPILIDFIKTLYSLPESTFRFVQENLFFPLLQTAFTDILQQWHNSRSLSDNEKSMFCSIVKLIKKVIKISKDYQLRPSWLLNATFLKTLGDCLTDIAISEKFLTNLNDRILKYFVRLIQAYIDYNRRWSKEKDSNKDMMVSLVNPVIQCLSSLYYINAYEHISESKKSLRTFEKLLLFKWPLFYISYQGSYLEQSIEKLLTALLPKCTTLLDKMTSTTQDWPKSKIEALDYLFQMINHGANEFPINAKLVSQHLTLIDHVLKLIKEPKFYNQLQNTPSNVETALINTLVIFLDNTISESSILTHIKQAGVTPELLRLTSCEYKPLVLNVQTLLAYTASEEDIKAMENPGQLLESVIKSMVDALSQTSNHKNHKEQLLETLKGLVQHDQIKSAIVKQNQIPFLLDCTQKLTDRASVLLYEVLWSLTFIEEGAQALRSHKNFIEQIQTMTQNNENESLKKAADGLIWKLVQEPVMLDKVAKLQTMGDNADGNVQTVFEEIIDSDGTKRIVKKTKPATQSTGERTFQYDMMISYCHADKEIVYKIHEFLLDEGFKIWIDLNNMHGPAMSAMAEAVENSEFVLLCMSDSYKRSTYCQAEAEYAFGCKRRLVPLIVVEGYRADGWLGFLIGSRIYIDYGTFDFNTACQKLLAEISLQRQRPLPSKSGSTGQAQKPTKPETTTSQDSRTLVPANNDVRALYLQRIAKANFNNKYIDQWTDSDVLDFLQSKKLIEMMPICESMDGRALIQLYNMCKSDGADTYNLLNQELKSTSNMKLSLSTYTRFLSLIERRMLFYSTQSFQAERSLHIEEITDNSNQYNSIDSRSLAPISNTTFQQPSYVDRPSYVNQPSYINQPSYLDQSYDFIVISNAPSQNIIRSLNRYGTFKT